MTAPTPTAEIPARHWVALYARAFALGVIVGAVTARAAWRLTQ